MPSDPQFNRTIKKNDGNELLVDSQRVFFESSENMVKLEGERIDLIITSPPYWNLKNYGHPEQIGHEVYEEYLERMSKVWDECFKHSKKNAILIINVGNRRFEKAYYPIAMDIYRTIRGWKLIENIIWFIPNALPQAKFYMDKMLDNKYENVMVFAKSYHYDNTFNKVRIAQKYLSKDFREGKLNKKGRCLGNVVRIPAYRPPNIKEGLYYEAAFPEELVDFLVRVFSNRHDKVLDPFLGSGTTLKITRNLERFGFGYEINKKLEPEIRRKILESWSPMDFSKIDLINGFVTTNGKRRF